MSSTPKENMNRSPEKYTQHESLRSSLMTRDRQVLSKRGKTSARGIFGKTSGRNIRRQVPGKPRFLSRRPCRVRVCHCQKALSEVFRDRSWVALTRHGGERNETRIGRVVSCGLPSRGPCCGPEGVREVNIDIDEKTNTVTSRVARLAMLTLTY